VMTWQALSVRPYPRVDHGVVIGLVEVCDGQSPPACSRRRVGDAVLGAAPPVVAPPLHLVPQVDEQRARDHGHVHPRGAGSVQDLQPGAYTR